MKRNMGSPDKLIRLFLAIVIAILVYTEVLTGVLAIVLLVIALILLLTSLVSFCPIYTLFGWSTCRTTHSKKS